MKLFNISRLKPANLFPSLNTKSLVPKPAIKKLEPDVYVGLKKSKVKSSPATEIILSNGKRFVGLRKTSGRSKKLYK